MSKKIEHLNTELVPCTVNNGEVAYFSGKRKLEAVNGIRVGTRVDWQAFTDSSGVFHPVKQGLIVESITLHASRYGRHVRIFATGGGFQYVEGNARFFAVSA